MKNNMKKAFLYPFLLSSFLLLFFHSSLCITYASQGLLIWFEKMIPTLFPFMVFSGFMVRSGLSSTLSFFFFPISYIFRITPPMAYALFMGFTCGFPMGAKVICDLLETKQITKKQGEYLLAFINNIGPAYLVGYVFFLFSMKASLLYGGIFYMVPLIYGYVLRFFPAYKNMETERIEDSLSFCPSPSYTLGAAFYSSLMGALEQINLLGGCMIIFNCLQIYPTILTDLWNNLFPNLKIPFVCQGILSALTEIGGGLLQLKKQKDVAASALVLIIFPLLTLGGLSCLFQSFFILEKSQLSFKKYFYHKINQSILIFIFLYQITKMLQ